MDERIVMGSSAGNPKSLDIDDIEDEILEIKKPKVLEDDDEFD